jgi:late competence protein required for DNA uptake (superfamily II DNA/RNA helicase)
VATSYIRYTIDESVLGTTKTASLLRKIIQVLEDRTLDITFAATYVAGTNQDVIVAVDTQTSVDIGFLVIINTSVSDDKTAELTRRLLQVVESETIAVTYSDSSFAGQTNQITIAVS